MTATAPAMIEAALEYIAHGDPVFPVWWAQSGRCACSHAECLSPAKHPIGELVPRGLHDATITPEIAGSWWARHPLANIGTPTGARRSVLDVDPATGGRLTLARLEATYGALPLTARVLTGGGGEHYHFAPVAGLGNSAGKVGPGLDVRGEGGYVLLPPSNHIVGVYRDDPDGALYETPLAVMPAWLVALASASPSSNGQGPAASADKWAEQLAGAPEGQRRAIAAQIAGHYLGLRIAEAEVETILLGYAVRCRPPFPEREVRELVRDLARRDRIRAARTPPGTTHAPTDDLALISLGELLAEPDDEHPYIVDGRLPASGLGLLAGKAKAGKSTLARCLARAVGRGARWLGHATRQGAVIYLALEEKRGEVRDHFRALGATAADPIFVLCASAPTDALQRLRVEAARLHPVLIIIDPLFRFVRVADGNDYATMTAALEPLLVLARESGAHVLLVHHLGKGLRADGDNVLGSTAIFGAVDTALFMKRTERFRTLSSIQRYGDDLDEIIVTLDPDTRDVSLGGTRAAAEQAEAERLILTFLAGREPVTEAELDGEIECRRQAWKAGLRALVRTGTVARIGRGGKADPFRYGLAGSPATCEAEPSQLPLVEVTP